MGIAILKSRDHENYLILESFKGVSNRSLKIYSNGKKETKTQKDNFFSSETK